MKDGYVEYAYSRRRNVIMRHSYCGWDIKTNRFPMHEQWKGFRMMDGAMMNNKGEKVSTNVAVDYFLKEGIPFKVVGSEIEIIEGGMR